jgi:hypothetical protein
MVPLWATEPAYYFQQLVVVVMTAATALCSSLFLLRR